MRGQAGEKGRVALRRKVGGSQIARPLFVVLLACVAFLALAAQAGAYVYWGNSETEISPGSADSISRANLDGTKLNQTFINDTGGVYGLDVNGSYVFWGNQTNETVGRADLNGANANKLFNIFVVDPWGVAANDSHVFWAVNRTGEADDRVGRMTVAGGDTTNLLFYTGSNPIDVALDSSYIYVTQSGSDRIGRANLDGTGFDWDFMNSGDGVSSPAFVDVDATHIYWTQGSSIGRADIDGSNANPNFITGLGSPFGIAVNSTHIYWTDAFNRRIGRANLDGTGVVQSFINTSPNVPFGIALDSRNLPTLSTTATETASIGNSISDSATLTGGVSPTGTITFRAYGPDDPTCSDTPAFTDTETVNGNGTYTTSPAFTPATAGTYRWIATYSGDGTNDSVTGSCNDANETSTVTKRSPTLSTNATASATIGSSISDSASLQNGLNPTGTISFDLYGPDDEDCSGAKVTTLVTAVSGNATYASGNYTPSSAGTYRWIASYSGDANNDPASGACNDANETSTIQKHATSLANSATANVALGGSISNTATLSGGSSPTGTLDFLVYGPGDASCSGGTVHTEQVAVNGNGPYQSASFTPTQAGTYRWRLSYSGDATNAAAATACNAATSTSAVAKLTPTMTTSATQNATVGGSISDSATLSGGSSPTGSITFRAYGPDDPTCTGPAAFTDTETVNGAGTYTTDPAFDTSAIGTYRWVASYSGDVNNEAVEGACNDANENSTVTQAGPTIETTATQNVAVGGSISDSATLSGGFSPGGTITFRAYGPDDPTCADTPAFTDTETVSGNGTYTTTPAFTPSTAGTYRWIASYSGDANNSAVAGSCNDANEASTVAKRNPALTIGATPTATLGAQISGTAGLAGGYAPTGTITFSAYGPNDAGCTGTPAFTDAEAVNGDGSYATSPAFTPARAGTYRWRAEYSGDVNNAAAASACSDAAARSDVVDPRCESLRAKLKRQRAKLKKANTARKRALIRKNLGKTKKRLKALGCS